MPERLSTNCTALLLLFVVSCSVRCSSTASPPDAGASAPGAPGTATGTVQTGAPAIPQSNLTLTSDEVGRVIAAYQTLMDVGDRTAFDVRARAVSLGSDADAVLNFVRTEIRNEVYPGSLRGAAGTLSAGAGNDLDKSLLLGALLAEAGHTVRYAQCTLSVPQAEQKIAAMFAGPAGRATSDEPTAAVLRQTLAQAGLTSARSAQIADARDSTRARLTSAVLNTARADLAAVRAALDGGGVTPSPQADRSIVEDARSHYWVQLERGGSWINLDASALGASRESVCAASQTHSRVPDDVYQTLQVTIRNEYVDGETLTAKNVLTRRFKVSDIAGQVLLYDSIGITTPKGMLGFTRSERFRPLLQAGGLAITGSDFTVAPEGGSFADALGGGGPEGPMLAAQWIDFTFGAPGRSPVTTSRALIDTVDPTQRASGRVTSAPDETLIRAALAQGIAVAVSAGRIHPAVALSNAYRGLNPKTLSRYAANAGSPPAGDSLADAAEVEQPLLGALALAHAVFAERVMDEVAAIAGPHVRLIRDQPLVTLAGVTVRHRNDRAELIAEVSVDLRHDAVRVVTDSARSAPDGFWANVLRGLVDGAVERHLIESISRSPDGQKPVRFDTSSAMELARTQNIPLKAVTGPAAVELLQGGLAPAGGRRLATHAREGIAVVTPVRPLMVRNELRLGLWTIHLQTGHLVPLIDTGLHGAQTVAERRLVELTNQLAQCLANQSIPLGTCQLLAQLWRRQAIQVLTQAHRTSTIQPVWESLIAML